jgi:hypothetical protein
MGGGASAAKYLEGSNLTKTEKSLLMKKMQEKYKEIEPDAERPVLSESEVFNVLAV